MATFCVFTRAEVRQFQKLLMWLLDLPRRDPVLSTGGGIFPDTSTPPPNPCPKHWAGYTTRHVGLIAKPGNVGPPPPAAGDPADAFAFRVTAEMVTQWQAKKNQLTLAQRNFVQSHLDSAADLAAEWRVLVQGVPTLLETDDVEPEP